MNKFEKLTSIEIENYKSIKKLTLELASVNILVGGNNAGKTCIIQAIHFATALTQTAHEENAANFSPEKLRYTPTETFLNLKYNEPLSEQGTPIKITFHADIIETKHNFALNEDGTTNYTKQIASHSKKEFSHSVSLKRGRNSTISTDNPKIANLLGKTIADTINPFSIYVPGLAGIPTKEEYRGRLVIDRGAMRGDANLFLRNILYRLHQDSSKLREFNKYLNKLFPSMKIDVIDFSERKSELIIVSYTENGQTRPLEMIGTGTLQAIQILSYITFYEPKILLLDEPDAHLHPNKQKELIELLLEISRIKKIQIIIATHSRHIVHSTYENADTKLFLISGGEKKTDNPSIADLLLDIGAIDKFDSIDLLGKKYLVLSEDEKSENDPNHPLRLILESNGINKNEMKVMAYNGCTQQRSVILLSSFMSKHHPEIKVIIHRDRDFMICVLTFFT
ncbi:AAA family ATPase [Vogesella indigofera]|uniref:AAA family ATPase n=1 Tax=Vogesella indigofera TaxID=45465 RepID=UPI00234F0211|nr:ATP-binding protein [Vogesella indigofera]MDC7698005.1 AAA family ATPase [Vogesella indigofera]